MENRRIRFLFAVTAAVLTLAVPSAAVWGQDIHNLPNYAEGNRLVVYMPQEAYTDTAVRMQVGSSAVLEGELQEISEAGGIETLILFDNSLSISAGNRGKMKEVVRNVLENPSPGERFAFATFDTEVHLLAGMTADTAELLRTLDEVEFRNQYTWLNDCIYSCAGSPELFSPGSCARIVVCSDGSNDNPAGYTADDVIRKLKQCSCGLLAVGSLYEEDPGAVSRMFSMARAVQGPVWLLDTYTEDLSEVTEGIRREKPGKAAVFFLEDRMMDGSEKRVQIQASIPGGTFLGESAVTMPFTGNVQPETEEEKEETEAAEEEKEDAEAAEADREAAGVTEAGNGAASAEIPAEEPGEEAAADAGGAAESREPAVAAESAEETPAAGVYGLPLRLILPAVSGVLLLLSAAAALVFFFRRRKLQDPSESVQSGLPEDSHPPFAYEADEEPTVLQSSDEEEATVLMMDGDAELRGPERTVCMLTLEDEETRQKQFTVPVMQDIVIGRKAECAIPLTGDRSVSGHHCVIYRVGDDLMIRDNDSANGTWLNRQRITVPEKLEDGDVIGIGRSRWIAAVSFR